jgi:hypothetical protein
MSAIPKAALFRRISLLIFISVVGAVVHYDSGYYGTTGVLGVFAAALILMAVRYWQKDSQAWRSRIGRKP